MLKLMFLHACLPMCIFTPIRLVIIPPRSKIVQCLTHLLFVTLVTGKEIGQGFVTTAKLMVYSTGFSCDSASVGVQLISICTSMETCTITFNKLFKGYSLALTKCVLSFLDVLYETMGLV